MTGSAEPTAPRRSWDRRRNRRYACEQALRYRSANAEEQGGGILADLSAGGISVQLPETFPAGSLIELTLDWPGAANGMELEILGRVLRSEAGLTAIEIKKYDFVRTKIDALTGEAGA